MSGHSKWSKVKHQKEATDEKKGKIFTKLSNAIAMATRQGGGNTDSGSNFKLRLAVEKAKQLNMPKEKIERAIERGKSATNEGQMVEILYEAFAPAGVGILIEAVSDNKQRTHAEVKNILERKGGVLGSTGSVSHLFLHCGKIGIKMGDALFDQIMEYALLAGAVDIDESDSSYYVWTIPTDLHKVQDFLAGKNLVILSSELVYKPIAVLPISDDNARGHLLSLIDALKELEDVHKVYVNAKNI